MTLNFELIYISPYKLLCKGNDQNKDVWNDYARQKNYVFDIVDFKRRYNIYRLENSATNPFIRFKVIGCKHDGLSIRFSRFDNDATICDIKVATEYTYKKYL